MEAHAITGQGLELGRGPGVTCTRLDLVAAIAQLTDELEADPAVGSGDDDSHAAHGAGAAERRKHPGRRRIEHFQRTEDGWRYRAAGPGERITLKNVASIEVDAVYEGVFELEGDPEPVSPDGR